MYRPTLRALVVTAALAGLAGCEAGVGIPTEPGVTLRAGIYDYRAWSDFRGGAPAWEGVMDIRIEAGRTVRGSYRLPGQCRDAWGFWVDCLGRVTGVVERNGRVRFGLDEGWLRNDGSVGRDRVTGHWDARLTGYSDQGTFELVFRHR